MQIVCIGSRKKESSCILCLYRYWGLVPHGAMGCVQKSFKLLWRCHQLVSGFLVNGHLSEFTSVTCQLMISVIMNDIWAVHRSPGIYLKVEENSGKPQLAERRWRLCDQLTPQMRSVGSHSKSLREKEGMKERRKGGSFLKIFYNIYFMWGLCWPCFFLPQPSNYRSLTFPILLVLWTLHSSIFSYPL